MESAVLAIVAYVLTGIALTSYDFAAPAMHRKMYVVKRDMCAAFLSSFIWPYSASFEAYQESQLGRSGLRFLLGVVLVVGGLYFWLRLLFALTISLIVDSVPVAYGVAVVVGTLSCPIFSLVLMPRHGGSWRVASASTSKGSPQRDYDPTILENFAAEMESWPPDQAEAALRIIRSTFTGDQVDLDSLVGELTVGQLEAVSRIVHKIHGDD